MSLMKWEPFGEFDRLFDERALSSFPTRGSDLAVDIYEEKGTVIAKMSLPGVTATDVDISIEGDLLTISGHREEEKEIQEKEYYSKEIRRGSFSRTARLPKEVEAQKATAQFTDGMLTITMPVVAGAKEKAVKVNVST